MHFILLTITTHHRNHNHQRLAFFLWLTVSFVKGAWTLNNMHVIAQRTSSWVERCSFKRHRGSMSDHNTTAYGRRMEYFLSWLGKPISHRIIIITALYRPPESGGSLRVVGSGWMRNPWNIIITVFSTDTRKGDQSQRTLGTNWLEILPSLAGID